MITRRLLLMTPLALAASRAVSAAGRMTLCLHQNTSLGAGYRRSLEGWSRAGIRQVELAAALVEDFLKTDSVAAARRVLTDLGLTAVCGGSPRADVWDPNPNRQAGLEGMKRRCEMFAALGIDRTVVPTRTTLKFTPDDYRIGVDNMREAGDIAAQYRMIVMPEFTRDSTFISTLPTLLTMTREAAHPNVRPMLDLYHFWSGLSRLEDLDLIRQGELAHLHFQDVPDMRRELLDNTTRAVPGEGRAPLPAILRKLAGKGYSGPASVELFLFQHEDPYALAVRIRARTEPVMRRAGVM